MSDELLKDKKRTVKLGDKEYILSPLNLNVLAGIEQEFSCGLDKLGEKFSKAQASTLRSLVWIFLKDSYPELTKEQIGQMIEVKDIEVISSALAPILTEM